MSVNVPVACAVADIKILPLAYEPKAEERYLPETLHAAAIAQLPPVSSSNNYQYLDLSSIMASYAK